jgi:hypothetical protein
MKYLGMIFCDENKLEALPNDELPVTTVRWRSKRVSVTDGPFAETNEQIGGSMTAEREHV